MKKTIAVIVAGAVLVMLAGSLMEIRELKQQIAAMRTNLEMYGSNTDSRFINIERRINEVENQQESVFNTVKWEYSKVDIDNKAAQIVIKAVPSTFTPESTEVTVILNGEPENLQYTGEAFVGTFPVGLFDSINVSDIRMTDNGVSSVESLNWTILPRYDLLLDLNAEYSGTSTQKGIKGQFCWRPEYLIKIYLNCPYKFSIRSAQLVEVVDDQEIGRLPVDLSPQAQKAYAESGNEFHVSIPEVYAQAQSEPGTYMDHVEFCYFLDKEYKIPYGSTGKLYVEVVDGNGLCYRDLVDVCALDDKGFRQPEKEETIRDDKLSQSVIYDENGKELFSVN